MSCMLCSVRKQLVLIALAVIMFGTHVLATAEPRMSSLGTLSSPLLSHMRPERSTEMVSSATSRASCSIPGASAPPPLVARASSSQNARRLNPRSDVSQCNAVEPTLTMHEGGISLGKCHSRSARPEPDSKHRNNPQISLHRVARQSGP